MNKLWERVDKKDLTEEEKIRSFLFLNFMKYSILGFIAWLAVSRFAFNSVDWAFCFAGYPGFFGGCMGGFLFLCRQ